MPKTTKREVTKREERIAKAHATPLPTRQDRQPKQQQKGVGYKAPKRGLTRYPWAIALSILVLATSIFALSYFHVGPFAKAKPKAVVKPTTTANLTLPNPSPCLAMVKQLTNTSPAPTAAEFNKIQHTYQATPPNIIDKSKYYCAGINTNRGLIVLELDPQYAPNTVNNFVYLADAQFYDGMVFHRVVPGFIIQTGDPTGSGTGGPGYKFSDEPVKGKYTKGCVAMANSGPNTNGSQFFICTGDDTAKLQKSYNLFGRVVLGLDVAQKIQGPGDDAASKNIKPDQIYHVIVLPASK
ncbi:MAG TPA: peptidylprolyl isomerase [Ktedonobacteraceae bacterium]|nr:peptidylprolyl isomerase [Ktedonobacteraceae bacterium]